MTPDTRDAPTRQAIHPDWAAGVTLKQIYSSAVQVSYSGVEQRQTKREKPIYKMAYQRGGLTEAEARRRLQEIRAEYRLPLTVPLWPDGIPLQQTMTGATAAVLDLNPIDGEWETPLDLYLWTRALGGEFRSCTVVSGRNLTLDGTGTLYPIGSLVFPCRTMVRDPDSTTLTPIDLEEGIERLKFRTL
jgi:hypothetical protein